MCNTVFFAIFAIGLATIQLAVTQNVNCDRHPPHIDMDTCCEIPKFTNETIFDKCEEELRNNNKPDNGGRPMMFHHGPGKCKMAQCVLNEMKLIRDDNFDRDAIRNYIETFDQVWRAALTASFDNCTAEIQNKSMGSDNARPPPPSMDGCNPKFMMLMKCMHRNSFINCPASKWTENPECNEVKEHMKNCLPPHKRGFGGPPIPPPTQRV